MNDKFTAEMNGKLYQVQILAKTFVDTTVAVMAESEEEATRMALDGVNGQPDRWAHCSPVHDLEVLNVSQETWDRIHETDQTHLLDPGLN